MKKTFKFFIAAIATVVAASCAKEQFNTVENSESETSTSSNLVKVTFSVGRENVKTYLDGNQVIWEENDCIAVWDGYEARTFTAVDVEGNTASFTGEVADEATEFYVVSPYSAFVKVSNDSLYFNVPSNQVIGDLATAKEALVSTAYTTDLASGVQLKNAVSLVQFSLDGDGVKTIEIKGAKSEQFAGETVAYMKEGKDIVLCSKNAAKSLTIASEGGTFSAGTYYAAIAPCDFKSGITVVYDATDEKGLLSTTKEIVFERNGGRNLQTIDANEKTFKAPFELKTTEDLVAFGHLMPYYTAEETVTMANDISLEGQTWKADTFYGTLDGQGNAITHIQVLETGNASFINDLYGTVKNIEFGAMGDGSYFKGNGTTADKTSRIAPIATVQDGGQLTDVVNYAAVESLGANGFYVAGICGVYNSTKSMTGCKNYGSVSYSGSAKTTPDLAGLIGSVSAVATIENCENYGAVTYCGEATETTANQGGVIAYTSKAITMKNCRNEAVISVTPDLTTVGSTFRIAGIAGFNQGDGITFEGCENTGNIECNAAGFSKKNLYMGGMLGQNESKSATGVSMTDCVNSGDITAATKASGADVAIGGMIGNRAVATDSTPAVGALTRCQNLGNLQDVSVREAAASSYIGGMIGRNLMGITITDCENGMEGEELGSITVNITGSTLKYLAISGMIGWQGSVTTPDYSKMPVSLSGCHNYAPITNNTANNGSYLYLGSMIAANEPSSYKNKPEDTSATDHFYSVTIDGCINDGVITNKEQTSSQIRMGGFIGDGANIFTLKNSTNNADVVNTGNAHSAADNYRVGGFVGSITKGTTKKHIFTNLANYGNVTTSATKAITTASVGGIIGFLGVASETFDGCRFNATVSHTNTATTTNRLLASIIGDTTKACTIKNCSVAGTIDGTELTAGNFENYLWKTSAATAPAITLSNNTFLTE